MKTSNADEYTVHAKISGPVVIIGLGSIGKGFIPLMERHLDFDKTQVTVIDPDPNAASFLEGRPYTHLQTGLTPENYADVLGKLFTQPNGFCINLSVDTSSRELMIFCRERGIFYIDTVVEPWAGFYFGDTSNEQRTNYRLRESVRELKAASKGGITAVSCCGANPGMVSWFVKEALMKLADDLGRGVTMPQTREEWARLMQKLGVKGVHIAERDTQITTKIRPAGVFFNTWSVEGFLSEGFQPAELGWGTFEKWKPNDAHKHSEGCQAAIWLNRPGGNTRVRTWCPTRGPQYGFLVTHNESISIADYFSIGEGANPTFRPTVHYAYHPCDDAVLSLHETFGSGIVQKQHHLMDVDEITEGIDELGVLLYGHEKNALWYGSRLSNEETKRLVPYQNATGLQVTSAVLAGIVWALENPNAGIVETEEMDHVRCLQVQRPYLGPVEGHYTDWTPLDSVDPHFAQDSDACEPWSFKNVLVQS